MAMTSGDDPLDALRPSDGQPSPSPGEEERAWARLSHAMAAEQAHKQKRMGRPRRLVPVAAALAVTALVAVTVAVRPTPAQASLTEIAHAARLADPLIVPQGSFIYARSERIDLAIRPGIELGLNEEHVAYLQPVSREVWRQPETRFYQISTTLGQPQFFDPAIEAAYLAAGLDRTDHIGETVTRRLNDVADPLIETDWPTQDDRLRQAMQTYAQQGGDERPLEAQLLDLAADLLRESNPSPELRSAILQVLAQLPLDLQHRGSDQTITVAITYRGPLLTRDTVTLSPDGHLLAQTTTLLEADSDLRIPPNTMISSATYQLPRIVTNLTDDHPAQASP